jgi:transcriptional regulator with XRE-family HTH domain
MSSKVITSANKYTIFFKNDPKIGARIKALRKIKKMTILDLSRMAGIARSTMGQIEKSSRSISQENLNKLAVALEVDVSEIIGFTTINLAG